MFRRIPWARSCLRHLSLLKQSGQPLRPLDVPLLRPLVAAGEQDHDGVAALRDVDPITGPKMHARLRDTLTDRPHVAKVAERHATDAGEDSRSRLTIAQSSEPRGVLLGLTDLDAAWIVFHGIHVRKWPGRTWSRNIDVQRRGVAPTPSGSRYGPDIDNGARYRVTLQARGPRLPRHRHRARTTETSSAVARERTRRLPARTRAPLLPGEQHAFLHSAPRERWRSAGAPQPTGASVCTQTVSPAPIASTSRSRFSGQA